MLKLETKHLVTGEELNPQEIGDLISLAERLKKQRSEDLNEEFLIGKHLAMIFDTPSLRTRFSFTVAMNELGGNVVESVRSTRKSESPEVTAQVLAGYCQGIMIRTFDDADIVKMAEVSKVPVINGLSDLHHPCQILADFLTIKESFGTLEDRTLAYIGDGNNMLHSFLLMAPQMGINIRYACPEGYKPNGEILKRVKDRTSESGGTISEFSSPEEAVLGSDVVYTDTWVSMGQESEKAAREKAFVGYQVNESLMSKANHGAIFMHCMPMDVGNEVNETIAEKDCSVIFRQSENRLHAQKALLIGLMG